MKKTDIYHSRLAIPILYLAACHTQSIFVDEAEWTYFSPFVSYSWFIIDDHFQVNAFGDSAPKIFERAADDLLHSDFGQLLIRGAEHQWKQLGAAIRTGKLSGMTLHQKFKTSGGRVLHTISTLSDYKGMELLVKIHIPAFPDAVPDTGFCVNNQYETLSGADRRLAEELHDYILNHLDDRLPSAKALSQKFFTNEFTLKLRFRQVYGYSIYKYFNMKRLDRAHQLILKGSHSLQDIAAMSGFATYRNFSTAFKKHVGVSPSVVLRCKR